MCGMVCRGAGFRGRVERASTARAVRASLRRVRGGCPGKRGLWPRALRAGPGRRPASEWLQAASRNASPPRAKVRAISEPCGGGAST
jgi:hypothetical protein